MKLRTSFARCRFYRWPVFLTVFYGLGRSGRSQTPTECSTITWSCSRRMPVQIWGTAANGEKVTVTLATGDSQTVKAGQTVEATAKDGKWRLTLKPLTAGGPYTMTVVGSQSKALPHGARYFDWRSLVLRRAIEYGNQCKGMRDTGEKHRRGQSSAVAFNHDSSPTE